MASYHQIGNDSENLLNAIEGYSGAILSPVNYDEARCRAQIEIHKSADFAVILDPQMYRPSSDRGRLTTWEYFPKDADTADLSSAAWWETLNESIARTATRLGVTACCSPAFVPPTFPEEYYAQGLEIGEQLAQKLSCQVLQTAIVRLADLTSFSYTMSLASILSATKCAGVYLVFLTDEKPRLALSNADELRGAMRLISEVSRAGLPIIVPFSGPEMLLWKQAGATACASGKFFNLRRFTPGRWGDEEGGGSQMAYWFEESLLASLRESDLSRVNAQKMWSDASRRNPFCKQIVDQLNKKPGSAWVGLGWRQFLWWFADAEKRMQAGLVLDALLKATEERWTTLENADVFMDEKHNNGSWIRQWRRANSEYATDWETSFSTFLLA